MAECPVTLVGGGLALAVGYSPAALRLICESAFPPGKPIELALELEGVSLQLQGKSGGSKLRADGRFEVLLRLVSLRREQRECLERAFSAS